MSEKKVVEKEVKVEEKKVPTEPVIPLTNELVFHKDDLLTVKGQPFKIKEIKGAELLLVRTDIR